MAPRGGVGSDGDDWGQCPVRMEKFEKFSFFGTVGKFSSHFKVVKFRKKPKKFLMAYGYMWVSAVRNIGPLVSKWEKNEVLVNGCKS